MIFDVNQLLHVRSDLTGTNRCQTKPSVRPSDGMESGLLIGWQQQKAELEQEVCRLQEELAESRAEREELESRSRALNDRVRRGWGHMTMDNRTFIKHLSVSLSSCARRCLLCLVSLSTKRRSRGGGGGS